MRTSEREAGFTLIELMIAVFVVSIGMLAMVSMLHTDMRTNQTSERRMDASAIAQSILQEAISRASVAGYNGGLIKTSLNPAPGGKEHYPPLTRFGGNTAATEAKATVTTYVAGAASSSQSGSATHVQVVMNWQDHGVPKQIELRGQAVTQ